MPSTIEERLTANDALDTLDLIGTTKGLFTLRAGPERDTFVPDRPSSLPWREIAIASTTPVARPSAQLVGSVSNHCKTVLRRSDDPQTPGERRITSRWRSSTTPVRHCLGFGS